MRGPSWDAGWHQAAHSHIPTRVLALAPAPRVGCHVAPREPGRRQPPSNSEDRQMERVTQHGGQMWPDEKSKHEGQACRGPLRAGQGWWGPGGDRQTGDGAGGDGWYHQAQPSEESQTDGLVKEASPREGTGLCAGVGDKAGSSLRGAAPGLGHSTRAGPCPHSVWSGHQVWAGLSLGSVSGVFSAGLKSLGTAGGMRSPCPRTIPLHPYCRRHAFLSSCHPDMHAY